jgi:dienelactone hydrolase
MTVTTTFRMRRLVAVALVALLLAACNFRGPNPTAAILNATTGPFTTATLTVAARSDFGGGTIYYPTNVAGPFAVIAVSPGFTERQAELQDWGPRLASHGFVTIIFDTLSPFDFPSARSTQQRAALSYVVSQSNTASSPIAGLVDGARRGVMGHSMGGGASVISANADPTLKASVGLAPFFDNGTSFPNITVPSMFVACQSDPLAPPAQHASPAYDSIPATTRKSYIQVAGSGDHFCADKPTGANGEVGRFIVSWFKRMLDGDTRYDPWVCGASRPVVDANLNEVRSSCPS